MKQANNPRYSLSPLQSDQLWLLSILAGVCFVIAMVVVFVMDLFSETPSFSWSVVGWIAPWYLAVISGWIMYVMVPMYVAHGRTRAFGFKEWLQTGAILTFVGGVLMGVGFLLERGFFSLLELPRPTEEPMFADASGSVVSTSAQFCLMFAVWFALGGLVGASLYRSPDMGWLSIPVSLAVASLTGVWSHAGIGLFGFVRRIVPALDFNSIWIDVSLSVLVLVGASYMAWYMVRGVSLRNP